MQKKQFPPFALLLIFLVAQAAAAKAALPESYREFGRKAEDLVAPLIPLLEEGRATIPIEGPPSDHGRMADELESVARPGLLLALWLQMEPLPQEERKHAFSREMVAEWYRQALVKGTDPENGEYWGHVLNYHQHGVEMAILTMSLTVARDYLWDPLSQAERDQVADWLGEIRGNARYWNNHLYFAILVLEFLRAEGYGQPGDAEAIGFMFELLESMHMGNGWFKDGINETYDHYNAYAFHTYGMWWISQYGSTAPARAAKWRGWAHSFVQDYAHFYAASGEHLPYGRSITYRFNGLGVFGLAAAIDLGALPLGEMRRICRKNLEFFLSQPIGQEQGCLSIGWTDPFQGVAEPYSCAASPYWAAKGLFMLTLPPSHRFWSEAELPYPAERGDFVRVVLAPRFVLRGIDGEVELLNAGSQVSRGNASRYGPWKWSKVAYRTGLGFLLAEDLYAYPYDAALTVERKNGQRFGRHPTIPLEASANHLSYLYALGTRDDGFNLPVRTDLFWKDGWILAIHKGRSFEPVRYAHGGYSLGQEASDDGKDVVQNNYVKVENQDGFSAIQSLAGTNHSLVGDRVENEPRQHLTHPFHRTPILRSEWVEGEFTIAVLFWAGDKEAQGEPWRLAGSEEGRLSLEHPSLGKWVVEHPAVPALQP